MLLNISYIMKYFVEYTSDYDYKGVVNIQNYKNQSVVETETNECICINSISNLNRAFHLDTVYIKQNNDEYIISNILERHPFSIIGILDLETNIKYGFNKKHIPYYIFKPSDSRYPSFYVASKCSKRKKVYALVKFSHWNTDNKYPYGNCMDIIGEVGVIENEYQNILHLYSLQYPNLNHKYKHINFEISSNERLDLRDYNIMSIDPPKCKDIDDAFHLKKLSNNNYQIGIHIADVSHFIQPNTELDNIIKTRLTSVYAPHKTINMLPNIYSDDICSLLSEQDRYAFSLIIECSGSGDIISHSFHKTIIQSKKALSYKEADNLISDNDDTLCQMLHLTKNIHSRHKFTINDINNNSSNYLIQVLMILANKIAAETVYKHFPDCCLLRTHTNQNTYESNNSSLDKYLYYKNMNSATYDISPNNTSHDTLNIELYTHFTSPIRRYADIIVHRLLTLCMLNEENIFKQSEVKYITDEINLRNKTVRKAELKLNKLKIIDSLTDNFTTNAFIIEYNSDKKSIEIFIPHYQLSVKTRIFHPKLDNILSYRYENDCITITDIDNNTLTLSLFQEINVVLTPFIEKDFFDEKLHIQIEQNVFAF